MREIIKELKDVLRREYRDLLSQAMDKKRKELLEDCSVRELERILRRKKQEFSDEDKQYIIKETLASLIGLGPIEKFLEDEEITEIMVNGPREIYIEKYGRIYKTEEEFESSQELLNIMERILMPLGRRITEYEPFVDARLPDGSRVTCVRPPMSFKEPILCVHKFRRKILSLEELLRLKTMTEETVEFLKLAVLAKVNIIISGATSTGKTTLLNSLCKFVPETERIVVLEETAELLIENKHCVRLETRLPNIEGKGEITLKELVETSLHLRPDRIIVGEVRGEEAFYMIQALNTGHKGSMSTIHATSAEDALLRLETLILMSSPNISTQVARRLVIRGLDLVIHMARIERDRKIVQISYIDKNNLDSYNLIPLFELHEITREKKKEYILEKTGALLEYYRTLQEEVS